ncbi:MAG TPA: flagellar brake protein [Limnobacter sp.]|nr:flagellar brake protein [Limnobacter sp.]
MGKPLPFSIYDSQGVLLLAAGQIIASTKQLDELSGKGLYHNPRWAKSAVSNRQKYGSVTPEKQFKSGTVKLTPEEPSETGSVLKMGLPGSAETFQVRLVGAHGHEAFVVTHPTRDGQCIFVKEGQVWEFRSFYGLSVYHFTAMVEKVLLSPHPMLVISWPHAQNLEAKTVRSARRVACELPTTIRWNGGHANGIITNISTGGAEFRSSDLSNLAAGQKVGIAFQISLLDRRYLMELSATVASVHAEEDQFIFGVSYTPIDDRSFAVIHGFVCDRLIAKLGSPLYTQS